MKLSDLIKYPFRKAGLIGRQGTPTDIPPDIRKEKDFLAIYKKISPYSMVDMERSYALYESVRYILHRQIPGDFVECGVWKGGSCMLIAMTLLQAGITDRKIWLYDTYAGMSRPGVQDGEAEIKVWEQNRVSDTENSWCYSPLEEVQMNMQSTGYPFTQLHFIKGRVEDTIPGTLPAAVSLLRLDTDWYESTKHELEHLYPLVSERGILIIDDYGVWEGSRKATDEYFKRSVFLNRIDWSARLIIK